MNFWVSRAQLFKIAWSTVYGAGFVIAVPSLAFATCAGFSANQTGNGFFSVGGPVTTNIGDTFNVNVTVAGSVTTQVFYLGNQITIFGSGAATLAGPASNNASGTVDANSTGNATVNVSCNPGNSGQASSSVEGHSNGYTIARFDENSAGEWSSVPNAYYSIQTGRFNNRAFGPVASHARHVDAIDAQFTELREKYAEYEKKLREIEAQIRREAVLTLNVNAIVEDAKNNITNMTFGPLGELSNLESGLQALHDQRIEEMEKLRRLAPDHPLVKRGDRSLTGRGSLTIPEETTYVRLTSRQNFTAHSSAGGTIGLSATPGQRAIQALDRQHDTQPLGNRTSAFQSFFFALPNSAYDNGLSGNFSGGVQNENWNIWVNGAYQRAHDERNGNESRSNTVKFEAGIVRRLNEQSSLGSKVRFSSTDSEQDNNASDNKTFSVGMSLFAQLALPLGPTVTPVIAYERSKSDVTFSTGTTMRTGDFVSDIYVAGLTISEQFTFFEERFFVEPNASFTFINGRRHNYTLSDGSSIEGENFNQASLAFNPKVGWTLKGVGDFFEQLQPTLGIDGTWNLKTPDDFTGTGGISVKTPRFTAGLNAGLTARTEQGMSISLDANYSGLGSSLRSAGVSGRFSIPF